MEKITHKKLILRHLKCYGRINPMTALREYGCYRLSARISELRREGLPIRTELTAKRSRITGNYTNYTTYFLEDKS